MTRLLARIYWKQFLRSLSGLRTEQIFSFVAIGLMAVIFLPLFYFTISSLGGVMQVEARTDFFSIVGLAGIIITVLFAIPQVFKHLFSSKDVELLFTMPVATKHIYWMKYIQSFFYTAFFVWIILSWVLFSFGIGANVGWSYYLFFPFISLAVVLIGLSIAYLINLILIQIIPRNRVKELMTLMTGLAGVLIFLSIQIPNMLGWGNVTEGLESNLPSFPYLPNHWAGESLSYFSENNLTDAFMWATAILSFVCLLTILTQLVVDRGFRTGWVRMSEGTRKKKQNKKIKVNSRMIRHPIVFLGIKELRAVQRDPREWLTFIPFFIMMIFPLFPILSNEGALEAIRENTMISWLVTHAMITFFFSMLMGNFAASSIGREERAVWILRTLPLSGMQIALGKVLIHWLLPLIIVVVIEFGLTLFLGWEWYMALFGVIIFAFISLGMSSIGLWAGTIGGKYNPNNPQQRVEMGTGFLLVFINIPYMLLMFLIAVLLFMPVEFHSYISEFSDNTIGIIALFGFLISMMLSVKIILGNLSIVIGLLLIVLATLGVTYFFLRLSARRIDQGIQINIVDGGSSRGRGNKSLY